MPGCCAVPVRLANFGRGRRSVLRRADRDGVTQTVTVTIYGIKACDTMHKARAWLDSQNVNYVFHDYKTQGVDRGLLADWVHQLGWETLLNRSGTTFRKLPDGDKQNMTEAKAIELMLAQPSMIKRPVLDAGGALIVGFKPQVYAETFT
jgi:arsenate reductase (glutaredoxin)